MKKIFLTLLVAFTWSLETIASEITATVVFENLTSQELVKGEFEVVELNQKTEIFTLESFEIKLPESGKYHFRFESDDFTAYTFYPTRINKRNNVITVRLVEKSGFRTNGIFSFPINLEIELSDEQIEQKIAEGSLNFIMHGLDSSIPENYLNFKEKYGVGLIKENCVIDPLSFKRASENNQLIVNYLTNKYGEEWLADLNEKPFGVIL
ncbi:FEKKY domain-containing protein [Mongoliitalea lutea]|uniref:DUF4369 domain-containing protein n=1 Tax=Mongoliitalea lutea TaxID=849756 RepID=A0A8J3CW07_9BACT|nr:hypothetical protein [Mongoliitalea lutea]GHB28003.1 hypothetical protein GCM10008106_05690 [Mongoliitalea lutea]